MANLIYSQSEQAVHFVSPAVATGGNYVSFSPQSTPNGSGYRSDPRDLGAFPRSTLFRWRAKFQVAGTPDAAGGVELYWAPFDDYQDLTAPSGLYFPVPGQQPSGVGLVADVRLRKNMLWLGSVEVETTPAASGTYYSEGLARIYSRRGVLYAWNHTGSALSNSPNHNSVSLVPVPDEVQ